LDPATPPFPAGLGLILPPLSTKTADFTRFFSHFFHPGKVFFSSHSLQGFSGQVRPTFSYVSFHSSTLFFLVFLENPMFCFSLFFFSQQNFRRGLEIFFLFPPPVPPIEWGLRAPPFLFYKFASRGGGPVVYCLPPPPQRYFFPNVRSPDS